MDLTKRKEIRRKERNYVEFLNKTIKYLIHEIEYSSYTQKERIGNVIALLRIELAKQGE